MKYILTVVLFVTSSSAFASNSPKVCYEKAEHRALQEFKGRVVEYSDCQKKKARDGHLYHRCEVAGSNGEGAGDFEMLILLNAACSKVTFSEVTGQE